jgi:hypothetical protein
MKELPILGQSEKVQPSLGGGNFSSAMNEVAKADLQVASFGAEIAQNAAMQRAKLLGQEAGKNPQGQTPIAFTKTDEAYVQSYKQEAFSTLDFRGKQLLADMQTEIASNPTEESLAAYKSESLRAVQDLVANAPKDVQGDLNRSLEGSAQNAFYQLYGAYENKRRDLLSDSIGQQADSANTEIYNLATQGKEKEADGVMAQVLESLQNGVNQGALKPSAIAKYKETYELSKNYGRANKELQSAESQEKYLAGMAEKPWVKSLSPNVQESVIANTVQRYNQMQAALGAQQSINYTNYQSKIMTSEMTPSDWIKAESEVSGQQFAKLQQQQLKINAEGNSEQRLLAKASAQSTDAAYLGAAFSGAETEKVHNALSKVKAAEVGVNPEELSFKDRTVGSLGMNMVSPRLNKEASSSFRYGNMNQVREVADGIESARLFGNNALFADLNEQDRVMAKLVNTVGMIEDPVEAEKKLKEIREGIYNTTPEQKAQGKEKVNAFYKDQEYNDPAIKSKHILKALKSELGRDFFGGAKLPSEVSPMYDNLMNAFAGLTNDARMADELALGVIKQTFTRTRINGRDEYMPLAPETKIPASPIQIENNKKLSIARLVKYNESLRASGGAYIDKIEWPDMPTSGDPFANSPWGKSGDITLMINGKPSVVVVKSDLMTQKGDEQGSPNWAFYYRDADKPNGVELPIYFSDKPGYIQARWFPTMSKKQAMTDEMIKSILTQMQEKKTAIDERKAGESKKPGINPILTLGGAL